jgi:hypothetical protein
MMMQMMMMMMRVTLLLLLMKMLVNQRDIVHDRVPLGPLLIQHVVYVQRLLDAQRLRQLKRRQKVLLRVGLAPQLLVVDAMRHERVHEGAEGETVVPAAAKVLYIDALVVADALLAPLHERVPLAHAVHFD